MVEHSYEIGRVPQGSIAPMDENEVKVFLRKDGGIGNDPGRPLTRRYATITIRTSSEVFVLNGRSDTARGTLDCIRRAEPKHDTATDKDKRCHAAILKDRGALAHIVFKNEP